MKDSKIIEKLNGEDYLKEAIRVLNDNQGKYSDEILYIAKSRLNDTNDGFIPGPESIEAAKYAMTMNISPSSFNIERDNGVPFSYAFCKTLDDFKSNREKIERAEKIFIKYGLDIKDIWRYDHGYFDSEIEMRNYEAAMVELDQVLNRD